MYVSRLPLHVLPGKTGEVETRLGELRAMIEEAGGSNCRILRTHFGSDGQADVVLEQDADDLAQLEEQIGRVTASDRFQAWSRQMSPLLARTPKREAYLLIEADGDGRRPTR